MKSTPFFAGIGLAALLSSCSVYHSAPIDLNAEEASWKEASRVDSPASITQNQARQIGLVMNPDLNKARLKLASSNEVARQSGWWNDPSFSWDIEQVLQENTVNMSGSLGFTIPVTGLPALEKKWRNNTRRPTSGPSARLNWIFSVPWTRHGANWPLPSAARRSSGNGWMPSDGKTA